MKICIDCNKEKDISAFSKTSRFCKKCHNIRYGKKHNNKRKEYFKKYRQKHRDKYLVYGKKYRENNKSEIKLYNERTKVKRNVQRRGWQKQAEQSNPNFLLRRNVSRTINNILKSRGTGKNSSIIKYLPYTIEQLKHHLESLFEPWMNWNNYGVYNLKVWNDLDPTTWTWQIDHIIPKSEFDYTSMEGESFIQCWSLGNLRPLNSKQNILDGVRKIRHKNENK